MNNFLNNAKPSKLNITQEKKEKVVELNPKKTLKIKSFSLDEKAMQQLQELLNKSNRLTNKKISASYLIKALINSGLNLDEKKLINVLKDVSF